MRLLYFEDNKYKFHDCDDDSTPPYAILSHTWSENNDEEVTFQDVLEGTDKPLVKLQICRDWVKEKGLKYFWIDTCCINKKDDAEIAYSIRSMWRWYQKAEICFVYLSDLSGHKRAADGSSTSSLRSCRWFQRGWTLQELIACDKVEFYGRDGHLGSKNDLLSQLKDITGINLGAPMPGHAARLEWVSRRQTKRSEDKAYCMLGICDVPLDPRYGEGGDKAWQRLQDAIAHRHGTVALEHRTPHDHQQAILEALRFDAIETRRNTVKVAMSKTCAWIKQHPACARWLRMEHKFFWIKGKPGAGKSVLIKYLDSLMTKTLKRGNAIGLYFYFNARGEQLEKSFEGLYRSLLFQLVTAVPELAGSLNRLGTNFEISNLQQVFADAVRRSDREIWLFIDALDECREEDVQNLIDFFDELQDTKLHICFASRHYPIVEVPTELQLTLEENAEHKDDLSRYVDQLKLKGEQLEEIRAEMLEKANGIFLWIVLVVDILNKELRQGRGFTVQQKLRQMPKGLPELFKTIITRDGENKDEFLLCLRWIMYAVRPLALKEWYFAMMAGLGHSLQFDGSPDEVKMLLYLTSSSKGLAELTKGKKITAQFIHESVRDFLLKENGLQEICGGDMLETQAHHQLMECCLEGMKYDLNQLQIVSKRAMPTQDEKRSAVVVKYPFSLYAVRYGLHHANQAAAHTPLKDLFPGKIHMEDWITRYNLLRPASSKVLRYTEPHNATLSYVCVERGWKHLLSRPCHAVGHRVPGRVEALAAACHAQQWDVVEVFLDDIGADEMHVQAIISDLKQRPAEWFPDDLKQLPGQNKLGTALEWACSSGSIVMLSTILAHVQYRHNQAVWDKSLTAALALAARMGAIQDMRLLLEHNADPNGECQHPTVLACAVESKNIEALRLLLQKGAKPDVPEFYGKLQYLAGWERESILQLLLEDGATNYDFSGVVLKAASMYNHEDFVRKVLEQGTNAEAKYGRALILAASQDHESIVRLLLNHSADVHASDEEALRNAARHGHESITRLLLDRGADMHASDEEALRNAAREGHESITRLLLDRGADIHASNDKALRDAAREGHESIVRLLLDRGANIRALDYQPLWSASRGDHESVIRLLLDRGNYVHASNNQVLYMAIERGFDRVAQLLIDHGVGTDERSGSLGRTPLAEAVEKGFTELTRALLISNADANAKDIYGRTPLMEAAYKGHLELAQLLVKYGAKPDIKDNEGCTALYFAKAYGHEEAAKFLIETDATSIDISKPTSAAAS